MTNLSKAALYDRLTKYGFVLTSKHWRELDKLMKPTGYITPESVIVQAHRWGWSDPMIAQLKKALK